MKTRLLGFLLVLLALPPLVVCAYGTALSVAPRSLALALPVPQNAFWVWLSAWMPLLRPPSSFGNCIADVPAVIAAVCIGCGIALMVGATKKQHKPWEKS